MFLLNRSLLLIYLATLQFIAPLVHAHAGQQSAFFGLHVPGLEAFGASNNSSASVPGVCHASSEDFIFGVHEGINPTRLKIDADDQPGLFIPPLPVVIKTDETAVKCRFNASSPPIVIQFTVLSLAPRAPPIG